ncbi:MAG TPA: protein kinase [Gemmatimonadales bacterium]|nr:protein kinase [Gemmatimonadales bacterium]
MADAGRLCPSCETPIPGDARVCPSCGAISLPGVRVRDGDAILGRLREALGHRYRIEREIGQGGMAVVYLAHDLRHDRPVALKVLRPELSAYLGAERFLREIHIAAQLNHPHVLALYDSGEADGLLYFVMPYVEGESLRQRIAGGGPLPLDEAVMIAGEVADGLAYAHELGVVHRDIKPENILLSHGHAAIADFGIARALAGAGPATAITTTGVSPGTPLYMSPEQAAGDQALDHRADIYSLGCVLFEMLTGRAPYAGATPQALLVQHATEPVPSARRARDDVPEALDAVVRKALAKAPSERFQTAADLRVALGGPPALAARPAVAPRLGAAVAWRNRAITAAAVLVALAGAVLLMRRHRLPAPQPRPPLGVVVRPFEDRTGRQLEPARLITEALTERLQQVPALAVVAYPVVAELRDVSLDSLRARFRPDRVVTGYLDNAGSRLRVTAQVVNVHTFTAPRADSSVVVPRGVGVVDAAAEPLSVFVRHVFWNDLEQEERRARVRDAETWRLVGSARERRVEAGSDIAGGFYRQGFRALDLADSLLRRARDRDPASDLIPVDLAAVAERRAFYIEALGQMLSSLPPNLPRAANERQRALSELDRLIRSRGGPADALELRGRMRAGMYRELHADSLLAGATADLRAATDLDPHRARAWMELGSDYLSSGQYADALWAIQHARDEDVFLLNRDQELRAQFDAALQAGQFDVAAQACRSGAAEWPGSELFNDCELQLWGYTRADRQSAAGARAKADSLAPHETIPITRPMRELWIADILARAGLGDSADRTAQRATANTPPAWQAILLIEEAYLRLLRNDRDSALALIGTLARLDPTFQPVVRLAPRFAPLRTDPRFEATMKR